jgi:MYXO-CTERM domain-containing protein
MDQGITGFDFEVGTTGGGSGDPAIDLIGGEGTQPGWGNGSHSVDLLHYDFSTVPAPGALALLGLAGLTSRRRRRH